MAQETDEWDARFEADLAVMLRRYLAEHPPPAGSRFAEDARQWAENLERLGQIRLEAGGHRRFAVADGGRAMTRCQSCGVKADMLTSEEALDASSAQRVTAVLRHEQHARDGRPLANAWGLLADRIERDHPSGYCLNCEHNGR